MPLTEAIILKSLDVSAFTLASGIGSLAIYQGCKAMASSIKDAGQSVERGLTNMMSGLCADHMESAFDNLGVHIRKAFGRWDETKH
ncbi:hypothetical protein GPECTOR_56g424 [Gonium pectorale]|uniref:Uncharacterized protein n=1 Tax=Gonium pectorale TaxID=33097 RepID=A0A150G654_GONPE|nr:hypothetical protein GPECTOR_56g424 [Gonium pectorale]|eukprot:KXZ45327.1 hypothetical protein GPECTOR_56g424 [Gonium pectorale]